VVSFGNPQVVEDKATSIRIVAEHLQIALHQESYEVVVHYTFMNDGDETTVSVGFPISATVQQYDLKNVKIDKFRSEFNDAPMAGFVEKTEQIKEGSYYRVKKWFLRELRFPARAESSSTIQYQSSYSQGGFSQYAEYILGSARNWKGNIEKLEVDVKVDQGLIVSDWKIASFNKSNLPTEIVATRDGFHFLLSNYAVSEKDAIRFGIATYSPPKDYGNEFGDFNVGWVWDREHIFDKSPQEIILLTEPQIQLFINFFYAFRGYPFKSPDLRKFFSSKDSIFMDDNNTKYIPDPNFDERKFSKIETENIEYLKWLKRKLYGD
jgi:hypothetical protein